DRAAGHQLERRRRKQTLGKACAFPCSHIVASGVKQSEAISSSRGCFPKARNDIVLIILIVFAQHPGVQAQSKYPHLIAIDENRILIVYGFRTGYFTNPDLFIDRLKQDFRMTPAILSLLATDKSVLAQHVHPLQKIPVAGVLVIAQALGGEILFLFTGIEYGHVSRSISILVHKQIFFN
ncbi:MAG TPA: hypothetical protein VLG46_06635, partial [Anaerolineae bacterium]|nr:hypothetical protein [Anaerolineae bacterium]